LKRFRTYSGYLREHFGQRVHKISLDAGLGCPNRDGTISCRGCIFCNSLGSGSGALIKNGLSIEEQIERSKTFIKKRYGAHKFIAYFQSFSNTYAPPPALKLLYERALCHDDIVGLSVATRPDCISEPVMKILKGYKENYLTWIELGLQSSHDRTLKLINRGHDVKCFERAALMIERSGLPLCAHVILGLPGETRQMMLETARFIAGLPIHGLKLHLLYVVKGTELAEMYKKGDFRCLEQDEFARLVVDFLELIPPDMVIQRLTGDPLKSELLAPCWANDKNGTLKLIEQMLEKRDTWQGRLYRKSSSGG